MKKLFNILFLLPFLLLAQNPTSFPYGVKITGGQPENTTPAYITTTSMSGLQEKIPSAYIEKTANKDNGTLTTSSTTYPTSGAVKSAVDSKQDVLVSGSNIKTVNQLSLLGSGDINPSTSTAVISGCEIQNNGTTFNVTAGVAEIVTNTYPLTRQTINFAGVSNVVPLYPRTILYIDSSGILQQFNGAAGELSPSQKRANVFLGGLGVIGGNILAYQNTPSINYNIDGRFGDLSEALGTINISGNVIGANGANLQFNKGAGYTYRLAGNYQFDRKVPDVTTDSAIIPVPAGVNLVAYRNGVGGWSYEPYSGSITPQYWDDGSGVKATVGNNKYTTQRIYFFNGTDTFIIYLGQKEYASIDAAIAGVNNSDRVIDPATSLASLRSNLIVAFNATALNNTAQAVFLEGPKINGGAAGSAVASQNMQGAYNNSVTPQITTTTALGAVDYKRGSASDADSVFRVLNGAGTPTFDVKGSGGITALSFNGYTPENITNKQNSLSIDGTGTRYPTVDAINAVIVNETTGIFSNIQALIDVNPIGTTINLKPNTIYAQDNALILKEGNTINGNGATIKRNAQQTTTTTAAVTELSTSILVSSVPSGWKTGDYLQLYTDNTFLTSSRKYEVIILSIVGNTINLSQPIGAPANGTTYTWPIGTTVRKVFSQITSVRSNDLFTVPTKWVIRNLILDGNYTQNIGNYYWGVNMAVQNNGRTSIESCQFKDMPNETIFGTGFSIKNSRLTNSNGSFLHQSGDITVGETILGGEISGNETINTNIQSSATVTGHSEGVITFSFTSGRSKIHSNRFLGGGESVLGVISYAVNPIDGSLNDFIFTDNFCAGFDKVIDNFVYSAVGITANVNNVIISSNIFNNCGANDLSIWATQINSFGDIKIYDNIANNGTTIINSPWKLLSNDLLTKSFSTQGTTATPVFDKVAIGGIINSNESSISFGNSFGNNNGTYIRLSTNPTGASSSPNNAVVINPSGDVDFSGKITSTQLNISALNTAPSSATDTGITGEIRIVNGFIYVCVATNTWQRTSLSTW